MTIRQDAIVAKVWSWAVAWLHQPDCITGRAARSARGACACFEVPKAQLGQAKPGAVQGRNSASSPRQCAMAIGSRGPADRVALRDIVARAIAAARGSCFRCTEIRRARPGAGRARPLLSESHVGIARSKSRQISCEWRAKRRVFGAFAAGEPRCAARSPSGARIAIEAEDAGAATSRAGMWWPLQMRQADDDDVERSVHASSFVADIDRKRPGIAQGPLVILHG